MAEQDFITQTLLFAAEVGKDINALRKQVGKLSDLTTVEKENLVKAINELKAELDKIGDGDQAIPDWSTELENNTNF